MYKEIIVIAGLGSELCNINPDHLATMHLKYEYLNELQNNNSENIMRIIHDIAHTDKQISINQNEQKCFYTFIRKHYWDEDFKMGLVYLEDQETSWRNINGNRNNLPLPKQEYPQGWEWIEHIPNDDIDWFTDLVATITDDTDTYTAYEEGGRIALAKFIDNDQGNNPLKGIENCTLYQLAKLYKVKSEQEYLDNTHKFAKDIKKLFHYYIYEVK